MFFVDELISIFKELHLKQNQWNNSRTARVEKDWTRPCRQLRMTADFCPIYLNDCTAILGLITIELVIWFRHFFLIRDQGHILSNSILCFDLKILFFQKYT
jgi:hypothetical protein